MTEPAFSRAGFRDGDQGGPLRVAPRSRGRGPDDRRALAHAVFETAGVPADDARAAGDTPWTGDMMGIGTRGVRRLVFHVQRIRDGAIQPRPDIRVPALDTPTPTPSGELSLSAASGRARGGRETRP